MIKNTNNKFLFLILIGVVLIISLVFHFFLPKIEKKAKNELIYYISSPYKAFLRNINKEIVKQYHINSIEDLKKEEVRRSLEKKLSYLIDKNVENIFAIYKEGNIYKFLADASPQEKVQHDEIFFPTLTEQKIIKKIYKTKKTQIIIQEFTTVKNIGITILYPFLVNNKVQAIVFVDFTIQTLKSIENIVDLIKWLLNIIIIFAVISILIILLTSLKAIYFKRKAYVDELTGVYNRNFLEDIIVTFDYKNYAVALFDIDFFKKINDTYGHKAGDQILKDFAKVLKLSFRKGEDIIIRYGGEEFLVLIKKDRLNKYFAINAIQRALGRIRNYPFKIDSQVIKLTASVGVYLDTEREKSLIEAIKKADIALYKAKLNGRNRMEIYEEGETFTSISKINDLIEKGNLVCHYQPVLDLKTQKVLYFESLVRLKDNGNLIYPDKFLEVIKNTYIYAKLTKKVIEFNLNILEKHEYLNVSINLSPSDLINDSTVEYLLSLKEEMIKRLKLEVIETEEIRNYSKVLENLKNLKAKGYELSLDDFGSGYSNFEYILKLDIDYVKIDANLIKTILENKKSEELVKAVTEFCKHTGIKTIAEYVENEKILQKIIEIGVEYGQGYYFSKPKPIEEFLEDKSWDI